MKSVVVASRIAMLETMTQTCTRMGLQWRRLDGTMSRDDTAQQFEQLEGVNVFLLSKLA